jgi:hypothetical protein
MTTPTRLANKTIWALEDILSACGNARTAWTAVFEIAKRRMDPAMLVGLAEIRDNIATVERKARLARAGEYEYESGGERSQ